MKIKHGKYENSVYTALTGFHNITTTCLQRSWFLATLVALLFTPVSRWVGDSFKLAQL